MLSYEDCLGLCDLDEDEVAALEEHEHIPAIAAVELASYLVHSEGGVPRISRMILDDIEAARRRGDVAHVVKLKLVLKHFVETHPAA